MILSCQFVRCPELSGISKILIYTYNIFKGLVTQRNEISTTDLSFGVSFLPRLFCYSLAVWSRLTQLSLYNKKCLELLKMLVARQQLGSSACGLSFPSVKEQQPLMRLIRTHRAQDSL